MAEYIDKQAAIDALGEQPEIWCETDYEIGVFNQWYRDCAEIKAIPPADVRPVVRGCWVFNEEDGHCYCSECGGVSPMDDQNGDECDCPNYCPNCGADLRGGDAQ